MRLGLAQLNPTVGDLAGNRRKILDAYTALVAQGAELVVFPELAVCGYPPRDLLFKRRFVPDVAETLAQIAAATGAVPAIVGTVELNPTGRGRPFYNSAAFCYRGAVVAIGRKCLLPTYDVFDEDRYFEPATSPTVVDHAGIEINLKGKPEHIASLPYRSRWPLLPPRHRRVVAVTGACVVLRRTLWEKLGGFDPVYVNGCEDVDLCLRAAAASHVNLVALRSRVRHHISASPGRKLRDEANTRHLVQRWSDTLARHAGRLWCRDHLATYLRDPRDFPNAALARQAFFYALHLRPSPPPGALAGMNQNLDAERARWRSLFD